MTNQPRKPTTTATAPAPGGVTVTWTPTPRPYTGVHALVRSKCERCRHDSVWTVPGEPLLCRYHRDLAAYAALPWWRRTFTRKPRP